LGVGTRTPKLLTSRAISEKVGSFRLPP